MKVEIRIDPACATPGITITAPALTDEIEALADRLRGGDAPTLAGYSDRGVAFLPLENVIRIYAERQQVFAQTADGVWALRTRLYALEEQLAPHRFVRISNSEIVNAKMIAGMDFSLAGTIRMKLRGGIETYASRRYVSRIRKAFDV